MKFDNRNVFIFVMCGKCQLSSAFPNFPLPPDTFARVHVTVDQVKELLQHVHGDLLALKGTCVAKKRLFETERQCLRSRFSSPMEELQASLDVDNEVSKELFRVEREIDETNVELAAMENAIQKTVQAQEAMSNLHPNSKADELSSEGEPLQKKSKVCPYMALGIVVAVTTPIVAHLVDTSPLAVVAGHILRFLRHWSNE